MGFKLSRYIFFKQVIFLLPRSLFLVYLTIKRAATFLIFIMIFKQLRILFEILNKMIFYIFNYLYYLILSESPMGAKICKSVDS